jgi:hypothetical protein
VGAAGGTTFPDRVVLRPNADFILARFTPEGSPDAAFGVAGAVTTDFGKESWDEARGPKGAHAHIAGRNDRGLQVIEVWDSREDIDRHMDAGLGKAIQAANHPQPTISEFKVHKLDWCGSGPFIGNGV